MLQSPQLLGAIKLAPGLSRGFGQLRKFAYFGIWGNGCHACCIDPPSGSLRTLLRTRHLSLLAQSPSDTVLGAITVPKRVAPHRKQISKHPRVLISARRAVSSITVMWLALQ